jgi:exosortase/archaeosortase family protein
MAKTNTISKLLDYLSPVKEIALFLVISAIIIQGWKIMNLDILLSSTFTRLFHWLMEIEFTISSFLVGLIFPVTLNKAQFLINLPNNNSIFLFEGCSGLKQVIQFTLLILCYPGRIQRKLWYIPFSTMVLLIAAMIHFIFLCVVLYKLPEQYEFMHDNLSRWFFFGIFFLLWVLFIRVKKTENVNSLKSEIHSD